MTKFVLQDQKQKSGDEHRLQERYKLFRKKPVRRKRYYPVRQGNRGMRNIRKRGIERIPKNYTDNPIFCRYIINVIIIFLEIVLFFIFRFGNWAFLFRFRTFFIGLRNRFRIFCAFLLRKFFCVAFFLTWFVIRICGEHFLVTLPNGTFPFGADVLRRNISVILLCFCIYGGIGSGRICRADGLLCRADFWGGGFFFPGNSFRLSHLFLRLLWQLFLFCVSAFGNLYIFFFRSRFYCFCRWFWGNCFFLMGTAFFRSRSCIFFVSCIMVVLPDFRTGFSGVPVFFCADAFAFSARFFARCLSKSHCFLQSRQTAYS